MNKLIAIVAIIFIGVGGYFLIGNYKKDMNENNNSNNLDNGEKSLPNGNFKIDNVAVSKQDFDKFLATLTEVPNTRINGESQKGLYSIYSAVDSKGVKYNIKFDGNEAVITSDLRKDE